MSDFIKKVILDHTEEFVRSKHEDKQVEQDKQTERDKQFLKRQKEHCNKRYEELVAKSSEFKLNKQFYKKAENNLGFATSFLVASAICLHLAFPTKTRFLLFGSFLLSITSIPTRTYLIKSASSERTHCREHLTLAEKYEKLYEKYKFANHSCVDIENIKELQLSTRNLYSEYVDLVYCYPPIRGLLGGCI
jgi:hypothetical protein